MQIPKSLKIATTLLALSVQGSFADTLQGTVLSGLAHSPEILSYSLRNKAAWEAVRESRTVGGLNLSYGVNLGEDRTNSAMGTFGDIHINAVQPILDGGLSKSELRRSRSTANASDQRFLDTVNIFTLQIVQVYLEVLRLQAALQIVRKDLKSQMDIAKRVQSRVASGVSSEADALQTNSEVESSRVQLYEIESQFETAIDNYTLLTGKKPESLQAVVAPVAALPTSIEHAIALASTQSPKIMAMRYDALAAAASADGIASANRAKLDLVANATHNEIFKLGAKAGNEFSAQLRFSIPLYDGGASRSRTQQARLEAAAKRMDVQVAGRETEREMRATWNTIRHSKKRLVSLRAKLANEKKALAINLKRYDAGLVNLDTLLNNRQSLTATQLSLLNADVEARYNVFRVLGGTGQIIPGLAIKLSSRVALYE